MKMERELRVLLLTGDGLRHRYAASRLAQKTNLVGVVSEGKAAIIAAPDLLPQDDQHVIDQHLAERDTVERRLLRDMPHFPDTRLLEIAHGAINTPAVFAWAQAQAPDLIVLYGTSLVKPPLLDAYDGRIINLHLGLSPYYRGSGTNFWPLVYNEPECVGATIHLAVASVDAGAILAQLRPSAEVTDRAHELGTKTIMAGFDLMPYILSLYVRSKLKPQPQDLTQGRVCRRKDFNAAAVRRMWGNFTAGMMAEYLAEEKQRFQRYPIMQLPEGLA